MLNIGLFQISSIISVTLVSVPWIPIHVIVNNHCCIESPDRWGGGGGGGGGGVEGREHANIAVINTEENV